MFRSLIGASQLVRKCIPVTNLSWMSRFNPQPFKIQPTPFPINNYSCLASNIKSGVLPFIPPTCILEQRRNLTKFSLQKGKRKTVRAVLKRFYRLDWGVWIRGKCGRNKKLHTKSANRKRRLRQHVFTNASQSFLLDKMVSKYWRKPKYYIDDPYEPYHSREEFPLTRKNPKPFI